MFYVYQHVRLDTNEVFYVGKGTKDRAWSKHNRNQYWHNIVQKTDFKVEILNRFSDEGDAYRLEESLIKSLSPIANFAPGGIGGDTFNGLPEERKRQIRLVMREHALDPNGGVAKAAKLRRGKTKDTDPGLRRMANSHSKAFSGEGNPMFGESHWYAKTKKEADEIKRKISESLKQTYQDNPRKYERVKCPHCGKVGGKPGMTRYHFNNCKEKK